MEKIDKKAVFELFDEHVQFHYTENSEAFKDAVRKLPTYTDEEKHVEIYKWLVGLNGDFPLQEDGEGKYYWRKHLIKKLRAIGIDILPQHPTK